MINNPQEILNEISDFDVSKLFSKQMSINEADKVVKSVMDKLGFQLPMKLMAPATFFAVSNIMGSKIDILDDVI